MTLVLVGRAMQLQVFGRAVLARARGEVDASRSSMVETTRGRILDRKGRPVAVDKPCIDACVDYRAIVTPPDEKWVDDVARRRLLQPRWATSTARRRRAEARSMLEAEVERVKLDIQQMWAAPGATVSGKTLEEIEDVRRPDHAQGRRCAAATSGTSVTCRPSAGTRPSSRSPSPWYQRWLIDDERRAGARRVRRRGGRADGRARDPAHDHRPR